MPTTQSSAVDDDEGAPLAAAPKSEASKLVRRPASDAWAQLAAPLAKNQGGRFLFFGVTGWGKTTSIANFLDYLEEHKLVDVTLIHDVKLPEPQYTGEIIYNAREAWGEHAPNSYPARRVLRKQNLDHSPSVDEAARVVCEMGYSGISALLVIDEFQRALTENAKFDSPEVRRIFCEGLGLRASVIAAKQLPQGVPNEATGQSTKVYHHLNREGTNYLVDEKKISKENAEVITSLEIGEFVVFPEGGDFDGFVYVTPAP